MNLFKSCSGDEVDLDDPKVLKGTEYKNLKSWGELHLACIKELGYALVYMKYLFPKTDFGKQKKRIKKLCWELKYNEHIGNLENGAAGRNPDAQFWRGFLYRILDEIENLC